MNKAHSKKLLYKEMTRKDFLGLAFLLFISSFGIYELIHKLLSDATGPYTSATASKGTLAGSAVLTANSAANGGEEVQFESTGTTSTNPSGEAPPAADAYPGYTLATSDDFLGTSLNTSVWGGGFYQDQNNYGQWVSTQGSVSDSVLTVTSSWLETGTLTQALTEGSSYGSVSITSSKYGFNSNYPLCIRNGSTEQVISEISGGVGGGATSIPVSFTAAADFPVGSQVMTRAGTGWAGGANLPNGGIVLMRFRCSTNSAPGVAICAGLLRTLQSSSGSCELDYCEGEIATSGVEYPNFNSHVHWNGYGSGSGADNNGPVPITDMTQWNTVGVEYTGAGAINLLLNGKTWGTMTDGGSGAGNTLAQTMYSFNQIEILDGDYVTDATPDVVTWEVDWMAIYLPS
jgi:hypothetical protein